jgi:homeobox protein homothorax
MGSIVGHCKGQGSDLVDAVFSPHAGPSGAYSPDAGMGYMMDGQAAQMMHRAPGDAAFHNEYHYPAQYYGHHL